MSTQADDTQGLDEILRDFAKRVEAIRRGKTYGWENEKQAILGWVDKVVIGRDIGPEPYLKGVSMYSTELGNAIIEYKNDLRTEQRNILREHGYKSKDGTPFIGKH